MPAQEAQLMCSALPRGMAVSMGNPPMSIDLRKVQSMAVPIVYVAFSLNTTWPPLLQSSNADRMCSESSEPSPFVWTTHCLVLTGGFGTGTLGCTGEGTTWGRVAATPATEASKAAQTEDFMVFSCLGDGCVTARTVPFLWAGTTRSLGQQAFTNLDLDQTGRLT